MTTVTVSNATSGVFWANWSGVANLQHGGQYGICVQGEMSFPNDSLYFADGPNSCSAGTMLASGPTRRSTAASRACRSLPPAARLDEGRLDPVSIAFSDDVAGPNPSTWTCVTAGSDPCTQRLFRGLQRPRRARQEHDVRLQRGCLAAARRPGHDLREGADASVPDNPSSADQSRPATQANLSDAQCDTVTLDRSVPPPDPAPRPGHRRPAPDPGTPTPGASNQIPGGLKIGSLSILVPKRVKIGKVKQLVIAANASEAGRLSLRLTRGRKVISRLSVGLSAGQTKQHLRLPKGLKAGTYTVKIAFKARRGRLGRQRCREGGSAKGLEWAS